jgi:hypothetical protein
MKNQVFRQGDVLVKRTRKQPSTVAKRVTDRGRTILAYGEVTGHCHEIVTPTVPGTDDVPAQELFEEPDGTRLLVLRHDGELRHDEHGTIALGKGTYEIVRQREYSPEAIRNVAD